MKSNGSRSFQYSSIPRFPTPSLALAPTTRSYLFSNMRYPRTLSDWQADAEYKIALDSQLPTGGSTAFKYRTLTRTRVVRLSTSHMVLGLNLFWGQQEQSTIWHCLYLSHGSSWTRLDLLYASFCSRLPLGYNVWTTRGVLQCDSKD